MESTRQKDITDIMSYQLHVRIDIKDKDDILIHFKIFKITIIKSTCLKVKDIDLYKKPLVTSHLANTHKVKVSTLKTKKCVKIIKLKSPSKYPPMILQKTSTI